MGRPRPSELELERLARGGRLPRFRVALALWPRCMLRPARPLAVGRTTAPDNPGGLPARARSGGQLARISGTVPDSTAAPPVGFDRDG